MNSSSPYRPWYRYPTLIAAAAIAAALAGCGGGSSGAGTASAASTSATGASTAASGSGAANPQSTAAFSLTGTPPASITVGSVYSFQPILAPATGATVGYSVRNLPSWATFSTATGKLLGTPTAAQAGVYPDILITASTGAASASLAAFAVTVQASAQPNSPGTATLTWVAPTTNSDSTALEDLTTFRIFFGTSRSALTNIVDVVADGNTDGFIVTGLARGTYYFEVSAVDSAGRQSTPSNEVSKTVS
ncbi:MAG: putative Ig domain-containing protein [Steroidobacteraceae bacterium]